jgi:DNA-binding NtrC family response regulator
MKRVLIIEDDEGMRSLLKDFLEEEGYAADVAKDGLEVFRKISQGAFDLVITDIRMPGISGLDILSAIKKFQPELSVIIITAFGGEEVYQRSLARGADGYLEKPIHFDKLRTLINDLVSAKVKGNEGTNLPT